MQWKARAHLRECVHSAFSSRSGWQHSLCHPWGPGLCAVHDRWEGHLHRESFFSLWPPNYWVTPTLLFIAPASVKQVQPAASNLSADLTGLWQVNLLAARLRFCTMWKINCLLFFSKLCFHFFNRIQKNWNDWGTQSMPRQIIPLQ